MGRLLLILLILLVCLLLLRERHLFDSETPSDPTTKETQIRSGPPLAGPALIRQEVLARLAIASTQAFPGNIPWTALHKLAIRQEQVTEQLIRDQPTVFLQRCLDRYDAQVQGYSCILQKQERVAGRLKPVEIVQAYFREQPFSVFMDWKKGAGKAQRVLFVEGENHNQMLARPYGFLGSVVGIIKRPVDHADAKASGRYLIDQFGIKLGTVRTLSAMLKAKERNKLCVKYEGIFSVAELGNRSCYKLVRTPYDPVEDEGVNELIIYIDTETWLQVGSILKDAEGKLIGEYFFRDIKINPTFKPNQFTPKAL